MNKKKKILNILSDGYSNKLPIIFLSLIVLFIGLGLINNIVKVSVFKNRYAIIASDIVVTLLPTVLTVISILYSIGDHKIYGIRINDFRKLRNKKYFTFSEMVYLIIFTFAIYAIAVFLKLDLCIILIDISSIYFSIKFLMENLPIIEEDMTKINNEIREIFRERLNSDNYDNVDSNIIIILRNLILNKDIDSTIKILILDEEINYNSYILELILDVMTKMLRDDLSKIKFSNNWAKDYDETFDTFKSILRNLNTLFENRFFGIKNYYEKVFITKISLIIFLLNDFSDVPNLKESVIFNTKELVRTIKNLSIKDDSAYLKFKTSILGYLLKLSFSQNKSIFIKEYIDVVLSEYYYFIDFSYFHIYFSIFLYYCLNKSLNFNFKTEIDEYMNENVKVSYNKQISFKGFINEKVPRISFEDSLKLIVVFSKIFKSFNNIAFDYFLYDFIISSWIEIIFKNYNSSTFNLNKIDYIFKNIDDNDKTNISLKLNEICFNQDDDFNLIGFNFLKFYGLSLNLNLTNNDPFVQYLRDFKNIQLKISYLNKEKYYSLDTIKESVQSKIINFKNKYTNFDKSLECKKSKITKKFCFDLFDYNEIDKYLDKFDDELTNIFTYNQVLSTNDDKINSLKSFNFNIKNEDNYIRKVNQTEANSIVSNFTYISSKNIYKTNFTDFRYNFCLTYDELINFILENYYIIEIEFNYEQTI